LQDCPQRREARGWLPLIFREYGLSLPIRALQGGRRKSDPRTPFRLVHRTHVLAFWRRSCLFSGEILRTPEARPELTVVADQVGSPAFTRDLARMIRDLVRMDARGIVNVMNAGSCSWFEFAQVTLRQAGRGSVRVSPSTSAEARRPARRPSYSVLSPASLNALGLRMRLWRDALSAYLRELREMGNLG
jgi:dTDP-4-dehydrorhamnose reductase